MYVLYTYDIVLTLQI